MSDERNPLEQARRVYRYATDTMTYDAAKQSWKGSTEHALVCSTGNCNDIHALFISLVRSTGIPARLVLGQDRAKDRLDLDFSLTPTASGDLEVTDIKIHKVNGVERK